MSGVNGHIPDDEGIDYTDIEAKYRVEAKAGYDNTIVIDGVPVIDKSKLEKLLAKISKEFTKRGAPFKLDKAHVPWDDAAGKSTGYIFIEFNTPEEAERARTAMDKHPFDARHRFQINLLSDIETFEDMDEEYEEPEPEEFKPREHLRAWLTDPQGRDQYALYHRDDVILYWHGKPAATEVVVERQNWTEAYVQWSPLGTVMTTLHRQGVKLWGGPSFQLLGRFAHPGVKRIDFSPDERYLVTFERIVIPENASRGPQFLGLDNEGDYIAIWDVKTGLLMRTFPRILSIGEEENLSKQVVWPAMKWSFDGKYVARVTPGQQISVYSLPDFGLVDKKSIKIDGVVDFEWCPIGDKDKEEDAKDAKAGKPKKVRESILAYWTPEIGNQPARVTLMNFPSRGTLRSKNLFNVSDCKLFWQNQGDYLCVKVDRHTKTKKSIFCNLEIVHLREKDYPVEVVEPKDTVIEFAWEPKGDRFIITSTNDPNFGNTAPGGPIKTEVHFYQLDKSKDDFRLLKTLANRTTNIIRWGPKGRHVVLATLGSSTKSDIEFWDLDFHTDDFSGRIGKESEWAAGMQHLSTIDHYGVTDIEWDPSGRFVATSVSSWRHTVENGYAIWDFRGQEQQRHLVDRFKQFLWRPRPRTLLDKEQQKAIRKNLREYSRGFDEEDAALESNVSAELIQSRKRAVNEWNAWRAKVKTETPSTKKKSDEGEDKEEVVELIDEVIEQTEVIIG